MQILLNSDNHISGSAELTQRAEAELHAVLGRFADRLTRIEVHLKDVNSVKGGGDDIACTIEARPRGHQPVVVTERGPSVPLALSAAADTMQAALERAFGRLEDRRLI
jgi:hypothetical protein